MMPLIAPETTLKTRRLLLEPLVASHAAAIYEQLLDERLYKFIPQEPPISLQVLETRYRTLSSRLSPNRQEVWLNWAVRLCEEKTYVGILEATVHPNQSAAIAYMIFPSFWRQGYAKEGCKCIINNLFKDYEVSVVTADIDTCNIASISLVETLGMKRVSTQPNADFFKGTVSHEYRYELSLNFTSSSTRWMNEI
jgi:RimJ/RimL family protein N-acetyltransferase